MSRQASCPGCGAQVKFGFDSSVVTVCPYCRSVVARGDRKVEDLGKVADLMDTESPLQLMMEGRYEGVKFHLTGRAQLKHQAGGVWDEWYAYFADGRWGWLAEAQGRFYLTFAEPLPAEGQPTFDKLKLDRPWRAARGAPSFTVTEKGRTHVIAAEGEIPYRLEPNQQHEYADLSGANGEFATLDFSDEQPTLYVGREVTLDDLGVPLMARPARREGRQVEAVQMSCPQCGGSLALRAPDKSERVTCPNCAALLDVNQGQLSFLKALDPPGVKPVLALGSVGTLAEGKMTVIGFLLRSVKIENIRYRWQEYLLYEPRLGFRWLMRSDHHWSYVTPLPPGKVSGGGASARYQDKDYKLFQRATARVEEVQGEFYWKVEAGEKVDARDFVRPPEMLSKETTADDEEGGGTGEVNWSHGTYLEPRAVEKAFALKTALPRPSTVAPNQPFLYGRIYLYWFAAAAAVLMIYMMSVGSQPSPRKLFEQSYTVQAVPGPETTQVYFSDPIEVRGWQNLRLTMNANVENSWVFVGADLINEDTGVVESCELPVEYYYGVEDGESWSEGGRESSIYLSSLPAGQYTLRLEFQADPQHGPKQATVRLDQGIPRFWPFFLVLLAVSFVPLAVAGYHIYFETKRWGDSNVG